MTWKIHSSQASTVMRVKSNRCTAATIKSYSRVALNDSAKTNKNIVPEGMAKPYLFTFFGKSGRKVTWSSDIHGLLSSSNWPGTLLSDIEGAKLENRTRTLKKKHVYGMRMWTKFCYFFILSMISTRGTQKLSGQDDSLCRIQTA